MPFHWPLPRGWRVSLIFGLFLSITFISAFVGILVFGVYSELDNLHPSIVRLLPAGHSICKSSPVFESETCLARIDKEGDENSQDLSHPTTWRYKYGRDDRNEGLSEDQCMLSFPGLFEDVHRAVTFRKTQLITSTELRNIKLSPGMARAMIFDGEVRNNSLWLIWAKLTESALRCWSQLQTWPEKDHSHSSIHTSVNLQHSQPSRTSKYRVRVYYRRHGRWPNDTNLGTCAPSRRWETLVNARLVSRSHPSFYTRSHFWLVRSANHITSQWSLEVSLINTNK